MSYAWTRLAVALLQLVVVAVGVFALTSTLPGDTAVVILGEYASEERVAALREQLGLKAPLHERFVDWADGLLHGDLGRSLLSGQPVIDEIGRGLATTALLAVLALLVVVPLALAIGIASGVREGSRTDRVLNSSVALLNAIPEFALGMLLVGLLSMQAGWLPATAAGLSGLSLAEDPAVLVLPIAVLVAKQLCALARQIRIGVVEATHAEYATHARLLGLPERTVLFKHVLPNAIGPSVQQLARTVDGLLGGVVVVEALFVLPGLGSGFVDAVRARDLPVVQVYALVFALTAITVNWVADVVAHRLVPQREVLS